MKINEKYLEEMSLVYENNLDLKLMSTFISDLLMLCKLTRNSLFDVLCMFEYNCLDFCLSEVEVLHDSGDLIKGYENLVEITNGDFIDLSLHNLTESEIDYCAFRCSLMIESIRKKYNFSYKSSLITFVGSDRCFALGYNWSSLIPEDFYTNDESDDSVVESIVS